MRTEIHIIVPVVSKFERSFRTINVLKIHVYVTIASKVHAPWLI